MKKQEENKNLSGKKILLVDDEEDLLESNCLLLGLEGAEVYVAINGQEAKKFLEINNYDMDIVITDVRMPNGDGKELVKSIRGESKDIPIICVSGFSDYSNQEILSWGANACLFKPVLIKSLIKSIEEVL